MASSAHYLSTSAQYYDLHLHYEHPFYTVTVTHRSYHYSVLIYPQRGKVQNILLLLLNTPRPLLPYTFWCLLEAGINFSVVRLFHFPVGSLRASRLIWT